jgi:hypothetical protein
MEGLPLTLQYRNAGTFHMVAVHIAEGQHFLRKIVPFVRWSRNVIHPTNL